MAYEKIEEDDKNGCHYYHKVYLENFKFDKNPAILQEG